MEKTELELVEQSINPTTDNAAPDAAPASEAEQTEVEQVENNADINEDADKFLAKLIEAAERRGYVKARNELAKAAMESPRLWQNPLRSKQQPAEHPKPAHDTDFLTHLTPNVWD